VSLEKNEKLFTGPAITIMAGVTQNTAGRLQAEEENKRSTAVLLN
jgi:hypothetical protein